MLQRSNHEWPDGLDEKIRVLDRTRSINPNVRDCLDKLRRWGNAAAHPEANLLTEEQQKVRANLALELALELLQTVFQERHHGTRAPNIEIVDEGNDELRDASYRALVENSASDQTSVALFLRSTVQRKIDAINASSDPNTQWYQLQWEIQEQEERILDLLRYASDAGYAPAEYLYGLALTEGRCGQEKIMMGVNLIARASHSGDINALAWYGGCALHGTFDQPVDYVLAHEYLQRAAAEDHPVALTLLSTIYRNGLGVEPDENAALTLTSRAANAGYAVAQYSLGASLLNTGAISDEQSAFQGLEAASEAGLPEAKYALAQNMLNGRLAGEPDTIESLLRDASMHLNEAQLDLSEIYMAEQDHYKWLDAAGRIQATYEVATRENDQELKRRCLALSPRIISSLEAVFMEMPHTLANDFLVTRFLFDENQMPYANREERMKRMGDLFRQHADARNGKTNKEAISLREFAPVIGNIQTTLKLPGVPNRKPQVREHIANARIGRNEPCPCGSGKKFKRCHALD